MKLFDQFIQSLKEVLDWIDSIQPNNVILCLMAMALLFTIYYVAKHWKEYEDGKKRMIRTTRNQRDMIGRRPKK